MVILGLMTMTNEIIILMVAIPIVFIHLTMYSPYDIHSLKGESYEIVNFNISVMFSKFLFT